MASEEPSSPNTQRARQRRQASRLATPDADASPRSASEDAHRSSFEREKDLESLTVASVPSLVADARKDDAISNERAAEALYHLANTEAGQAAVAAAGGHREGEARLCRRHQQVR